MTTTIKPTTAPAVPMTPELAAASARLRAAHAARRAACDAFYSDAPRRRPAPEAPIAERVEFYERRERLEREKTDAFQAESDAMAAWCAAYDAALAAVPTEVR